LRLFATLIEEGWWCKARVFESNLTTRFRLVKLPIGSPLGTPEADMKKTILGFACVAVLPLAGCSRSDHSAKEKAEAGRGTFVSTNGEAVTAIYFKTGGARDRGTVQLRFSNKTQEELFQALSASGARYTNNTTEWWEHQGEATYEVGGTNRFRGKIMSSK